MRKERGGLVFCGRDSDKWIQGIAVDQEMTAAPLARCQQQHHRTP